MSATGAKGKWWKLLLLAENDESKREYGYVSAALVALARLIRSSTPADIVVATNALGSIWFSSSDSSDDTLPTLPPTGLTTSRALENAPLFATRRYTSSNMTDTVEAMILPSSWTLTQTTANILVDPLNVYRFPILNILNAFEYMAVSIFWKGYDYNWDKRVNDEKSKNAVIMERFERTVAALCIALVFAIREYKHHYAHVDDLTSKILERLESFLSAEGDYRSIVENSRDNIKLVLSYLKSEAWSSNDTLSFVGSVYDAILGEGVMTLLGDLIKEEYLLLLKLASGPNIAIVKHESSSSRVLDDETRVDDLIESKQPTLENFKVYNSHPFYVMWNFLTLMAGVRTCPTVDMHRIINNPSATAAAPLTGRTSRHLLAALLSLDMVPLLMCSVCSSGLDHKLKTVRSLYEEIVDGDNIRTDKLRKFSRILPRDVPSNDGGGGITLEKIFRHLLERRWQGSDAPTGIRGARLALQKKTAALSANMSGEIEQLHKIEHDLYAFLSFYLLFISSRTEEAVNLNEGIDNASLPLLGQTSVTKLRVDTPHRLSYEMQDNCWLLTLVGIWALRNAIRVGKNTEPYPLINFLSGVSRQCVDSGSGEDLVYRVVNHPIIKDISLQNLDYAFAQYSNRYRIYSSESYAQGERQRQRQHVDPKKNKKNTININGVYVLSKKHLEQMSVEDLLDLERLPLTEYEIYHYVNNTDK
uniref:Wsv327-like protein n=1 Tax=Penaeus monodon majanivirus A TaxID=2984271 RepID=A0A9C7EZY3_9VIRU|nr:MAG: wsv327-like protein [Penaeus monodon majanivirus A]